MHGRLSGLCSDLWGLSGLGVGCGGVERMIGVLEAGQMVSGFTVCLAVCSAG